MKKLVSRVGLIAFAAVVCGVVGVGAQALAATRLCGPRNCLDVWNPVTCSNGVTYSNSCYAARACATGCVPSGDR
jgi:hypothetical protein